MRRKDREITDEKAILEIIRAADAGRLVLNGDDGWPYIVPLNFGERVENGRLYLYFHGTMAGGKKYDLMERDSRAAFEVDTDHELRTDRDGAKYTMAYKSVIMYGRIEMVGEVERPDALRVLLAHYGAGDAPINAEVVKITRCWRLAVERISAKERK